MKKIKFLFLVFIIIFLYSCNFEKQRNKFSQNENITNIYREILKIKSSIIKNSNIGIEVFLLKFSPKHKNHWLPEDAISRESFPIYSFLESEKKPVISNNKNENTFNNWYRSHGNHSANRFSELKLINKDNVKNLEVAWIYNSGKAQDIQCNPIVVKGVIYTPIGDNRIAAINGYNGKIIWKSKKFKSVLAKRGLIYWEDPNSDKKMIFFSSGKNLVSLNAIDGSFQSDFGSNGVVRTGVNLLPPVIYKNQIVIATLSPDHNIESHNVLTGKLEWKLNYKKKNSKRVGGVPYDNSKGNPWGGSSLDINRGIFYIATGNPNSYFNGTRRPGVNEDTDSIIAIDLNKKKKIWSFQETRHDIWNLDLPSPPILTTMKKNNKLIDVVVNPTKSGNTLILDRLTGKPIYEFRLKKTKPSKILGERTSIYQPDLKTPEPFEKVFFKKSDMRKKFINGIYKKNIHEFGWYKAPQLNTYHVRGGITGGAEWTGASVDHKKHIMYVTSNNIAMESRLMLVSHKKNRAPIFRNEHKRLLENNLYPMNKPPWGTLNALNINSGKLLWKVPLGNYESFKSEDKSLTGTENFGGTTVTRGGITITSGTLDKKIYFHNAENGDLLKSILLPYIGSSPPTTYSVNGEQFIIIHSTGGTSLKLGYGKLVETGDALVALKLKIK